MDFTEYRRGLFLGVLVAIVIMALGAMLALVIDRTSAAPASALREVIPTPTPCDNFQKAASLLAGSPEMSGQILQAYGSQNYTRAQNFDFAAGRMNLLLQMCLTYAGATYNADRPPPPLR